MYALTFETRGTLKGTNMFAEDTFRTEVSTLEPQTVLIACQAAWNNYIVSSDTEAQANRLLNILLTFKNKKGAFKSTEIMDFTYSRVSARVLCKLV